MPGIMRPFMATKKLVVTSSTQPKGMGCITVVKVMGMADSSIMRWNNTRLPRRSVCTPIQREVNKVTAPPHR